MQGVGIDDNSHRITSFALINSETAIHSASAARIICKPLMRRTRGNICLYTSQYGEAASNLP
jgi:type IV secretory pathway VirB9-like protein